MLCVARREYLERVRSKAFVVGTVLGPLLLIGVMLGPSLLLSKQRGKPLRVAVLDHTGELREPVARAIASRRAAGQPRFDVVPPGDEGPAAAGGLRELVLKSELDGFVELTGNEPAKAAAAYYSRNVSNIMDLQPLEQAVEEAVIDHRLPGRACRRPRARSRARRSSRPSSSPRLARARTGARRSWSPRSC
jgi:ABC-2 type transport system permease protein